MNSTQWKEDVRMFWKKPLNEQEENTLLMEGEYTLARGISRSQFLDSFEHEDDDFARGMEWRAVGKNDSDVGDILVINFRTPHTMK